MALTDPLPNYDNILIILLPFNIAVALFVGIFYIWRYKKTEATVTLLWALGFTGVGIGILINYLIRYIFYDYVVTRLPSTWDYSLFNRIGMLLINFSLAQSIFYIGELKEKTNKIGKIISGSLTIFALICLIINTFTLIELYPIASWIARILAFWVIIFFTYLSINSKNYRIITITIGLILATVGGILMTQFYGNSLGLIGNILQFGFFVFIAYGLFFTRHQTT